MDGKMTGRRWREDGGQGLIEIALVLPVFLIMVFGFISFAMVMYGASNATYANRRLIRYACVHSSTSFKPITSTDVNSIINPFMNNFPPNTLVVRTSWGTSAPALGSRIDSTLSITYHITLVGFMLSPLTVQATAAGMVVQ